LRPPRLPRALIPRTRVRDRLDALGVGRVALVAAPLGYGKTIAVCDWLTSSKRPSSWLTLEAADNDTARLRAHLDAARRDVFPGAVVVLDGVDAITDADARTCLDTLMAEPWLRFVLISRAPVELPALASMPKQVLVRVGPENLRFDDDEAAGLLTSVLGRPLDAQYVRRLVERSEGWPAGLHLAALALHDGEPDATLESFTGDHPRLAELFLLEVLADTAPDLVAFLLDTSVLDTLDAGSCEGLTGRGDTPQMLRGLARAGLFVELLDGAGDKCRLHGLFREALESELRRRDQPRWREQHRRAAALCEASDDLTSALRHHMAAGDRKRAWELLRQYGYDWFFSGHRDAIEQWTELLAADAVAPTSDEAVDLALSMLLLGKAASAGGWLARAERDLGDPAHVTRPIAAPYAFARHLHAFASGDLDAAWRRLSSAKQLFERWIPGEWRLLRGPLAEARLLSILGDHVGARRCYESFAAEQADRSVTDRVVFPATLASIAFAEGELAEALRVADRSLRMASWCDREHSLVEAEARFVRGAVLLEQHRIDEAATELDASLALAEESRFVPAVVLPGIQRAFLHHACGRSRDAHAALDELRVHVRGAHRSLLAARLDVAAARMALHDGDLDAAGRAISRLHHHRRSLLEAQLHAGSGRRAEALAALDRADTSHRRGELRALLIRACCASGDDRVEIVREALRFGEGHGYRRIFLEQRTWILPVLVDLAASWPSAYAGAVLDVFPGASATYVVDDRHEELSEREREVWRYLATPLSMREIAQLLYVSRNTLKTHTRSIYRKLGVSSRAGAVARLRATQGDTGDGTRLP
jgi:LuxR family maltose regulon positive regulatory protein